MLIISRKKNPKQPNWSQKERKEDIKGEYGHWKGKKGKSRRYKVLLPGVFVCCVRVARALSRLGERNYSSFKLPAVPAVTPLAPSSPAPPGWGPPTLCPHCHPVLCPAGTLRAGREGSPNPAPPCALQPRDLLYPHHLFIPPFSP